jgi:ATP-binding cassette subfamily B multidrug efflux pump
VKIIRRLWPYWRSGWVLILISVIQIGLVAGLAVLMPQIVRWVIDHVLVDGDWSWLVPGALAVVAAAVVQGFLRFGQRYTMELVSQRVIYELRSDLYRHLQSLSFGFYDRAKTGELMSRVTADVETLRHAAGMGFVNGLMHLGTVFGIIIAMFVMDWRLAGVTLLFMPLLIYTIGHFSKQARPMWTQIQAQTATLSAVIQENIAGVRVVRAFAREEGEVAKFRTQNVTFLNKNIAAIRLMAFWSNFMNFLTALGGTLVLWYGGRRVMEQEISIGTLIAFNTYVASLIQPVRMMGWIVAIFSRAAAGAQRIFELLDARSDVVEKPDAQKLERVQGHIRFEEISFSYSDGEAVLDQVSLEVMPGQRVAVLGMTGSGKSSLINLIPRFYDPTLGRVLIDGIDLRDVTMESLRSHMAIMLQETFLFSTTLRENIAYGRPDASKEQIVAAAKAAQIHEFIDGLPDGYETLVGERGVGLSGGQKQRIAIARALLLNSPILIMDESTSAVDVQTEHLIQGAIARVMENRTSFVIASRLSTVMSADMVVVLEHGQIVQVGSHAELIRQEGLYREIYNLQLKPAEEALAAQRGGTD